MYTILGGIINMAITNKQKRQLTCQFCPKKGQRAGCSCKKYWKEVYREHREDILKIYRRNSSNPP